MLVALAWQVASGADPAIGAGEQAAAQQPVQRVVVRRVVRRVIVTRRAPADRTAPAQQPAAAAPAAAAPAAAAAAPAPGAGSRAAAADHERVMTHDVTFRCMGCTMRLLTDGADDRAIAAARELLDAIDGRLSRFRPDSELVRLNADPRPTVPASALLRAAVGAALWAAERTGGLVDPTLLGDLEREGYTGTLADGPRAGLGDALAAAPPRAAAAPRPGTPWRAVRIDNAAGTITRPPGLRLDTGGTTKGLAADAAARVLAGARRLVVDCGGDLRVAVARGSAAYDVAVAHPLHPERAATLRVRGGGVATSGLGRRLWHGAGGQHAHHLLDPATGAPAWTGLIAATALAPSTLAAEALAKAALLSGPEAARRLLARRGGVLVHDDGTVERIGPRRTVRPDAAPEGGGMRSPDPTEYGWWLSSRAAGVVAFALIALSVLLGLAMANRLVKGRHAVKLHEHLALSGLVAIAVHGITLLGDSWLNPGATGLLVPFAMDYRPLYTGLGVIGGYLALAVRPLVLRAPPHPSAALAQPAPLHRRGLRARSDPRSRGGIRRLRAVDAGDPAGHRGADPVPARIAPAPERITSFRSQAPDVLRLSDSRSCLRGPRGITVGPCYGRLPVYCWPSSR